MRAAVLILAVLPALARTDPAEQIRYMLYETDRPDLHGAEKGFFTASTCGQYLGEQRDTRALAKAFAIPSALPAIEAKLEALAALRHNPAHMDWLLLAYARAKGPSAYPKLRSLYKNPDYANALDKAIALAFGITSYVSTDNRPPVPPGVYHCDRGQEPRDALNKFIREQRIPIGAGYQFQSTAYWAEPEETFREKELSDPIPGTIQTKFTTHDGAPCGELNIEFLPAKRKDFPVGSATYIIQPTQLPAIRQLVRACANSPR